MDAADPLEYPLRSWTNGAERFRLEGRRCDLTDYPSLLEAAGGEDDRWERLWLLESGLRLALGKVPHACNGSSTPTSDIDRYMDLAVLTLIEADLPDHALEASKLFYDRNSGRAFHARAAAVALAGGEDEVEQALGESLHDPMPGSATALWARAVLHCAGDTDPAETQHAIREARSANRHAETLMAGRPVDLVEAWKMPSVAGSREEAIRIAMYFQRPWTSICGGGR